MNVKKDFITIIFFIINSSYFPEALKEIMEKKDAVHRKLAAKTNFSFTYFCVLKKRKNPPPIETIKSIAAGLGIPPEYFLEYRIDKLIKLLICKYILKNHILKISSSLDLKYVIVAFTRSSSIAGSFLPFICW